MYCVALIISLIAGLEACSGLRQSNWQQIAWHADATLDSIPVDPLNPQPHLEKSTMNVFFNNVESQKVKDAFTEVLKRYEILHPHYITLKQRRMRRATMQARPVLAGLMRKHKYYEVSLGVYLKGSDSLRIDELPKDVLVGWFAHELGHLVDYERFSKFGMLRYGARYMSSHNYKKEAEHQADLIAVNHGFQNEIIATKRFILENELLGEKYKSHIRRYYMSIEDVEVCAADQEGIPSEL